MRRGDRCQATARAEVQNAFPTDERGLSKEVACERLAAWPCERPEWRWLRRRCAQFCGLPQRHELLGQVQPKLGHKGSRADLGELAYERFGAIHRMWLKGGGHCQADPSSFLMTSRERIPGAVRHDTYQDFQTYAVFTTKLNVAAWVPSPLSVTFSTRLGSKMPSVELRASPGKYSWVVSTGLLGAWTLTWMWRVRP